MFSNNKITGMTVVLSETLKEIITKNDVAQDNHPYSAFNCKKPNIRYQAVKPWEHVQRGEKPPDAGLYPNSGYTGHVPGARDTHAASFQSSLKLAQRATMSKTIREGEHYADGGHFVTSQEIGSLAGGNQPNMPPSARASARGSHMGSLSSTRNTRLTERHTARQQKQPGSALQKEVRGDVLAQEGINRSAQSTARSTARSRFSDGGLSRRSGSGRSSRRGGTGQESKVKEMFEQLPPSRREAILTELSSGWLEKQ